MEPKAFFKFCPKCGGDLSSSTQNNLVCKSCQYKLFFNTLAACEAIIENDKQEILLIKRRFNPGKGKWDVPGGFVEPGETLDQSIKREVGEELGVDIKINKIIGAYPDTYLYQNLTTPVFKIFVSAEITSGEITPGDDAEDYKFVPRDEVLNYGLWCHSLIAAIKDYLKPY